jgi:metal-dependent hydrolase (beta-lactamase superfamily II)
VEGLRRLGVRRVGPAHCTGEAPASLLQQDYGEDCVDVRAGAVLRF